MELSLKLPAVVGRYVLEGEVASGGMATVYHGRMSGPSGYARTIAIKRMHPHCAKDPNFVAMFLDEANLAARIRHPNVVPVLDIVTEGDSLLMVMEYVAGDTVDRLLRSGREAGVPPPHRVITAVIAGALEGLHAAHEAVGDDRQPLNIVHRDVSPQNIIVGFDGIPRVLDFGVAKAAVRMQTTSAGQIKGRLQYMAPEQIRNKPVDRRSDVYSASVVLWEALAGRPLFDADNEGALMIKVLEGVIPSLRDIDPRIPPSLEWVVLRGLRPAPADRFQTAQEMATAIERAVGVATPREVAEWVRRVVPAGSAQRAAKIAGLDMDAFGPEPLAIEGPVQPGRPYTLPEEVPKKSKNKRLLVTAFGVTVLLCVIGFWFALHEIPWLGPALIDTSRAVFGNKITAWIERVAHAADAGWSELWNQDERPEAYWNLPSASASSSAGRAPALRFRPVDLQPMNSAPFSRQDGSWMPTHEPEQGASPRAYRLTLHPDVDRADSVTRVVAFDLRRTALELAPGARSAPAKEVAHAGMVDPAHADTLMALIHGLDDGLRKPALGFESHRTEPASPGACVLAKTGDGSLRIDRWDRLGDPVALRWFRQSPSCLVLSGSEMTGLGTTAGNRHMAIGVSADHQVLYVGAGAFVSTSTMARVMRYTGSRDAALVGGASEEANVYFHSQFDADARELLPSAPEAKEMGNRGVTEASDTDFFYVVRTAP